MGQEQSAYLSDRVLTSSRTNGSEYGTLEERGGTIAAEEVSGFDTTSIEWEGYLEKKGSVLRHWKTRFCSLEGNLLSYYDTKDDAMKRKHLKGRLRLSDVKIEEKRDGSGGYDFLIETSERKHFHCSCVCDMERRVWIRMMEAGIDGVLSKSKGKPKFGSYKPDTKLPDESLYNLYRKVLLERRGMEEFVFSFSKDLIVTSNYPRTLSFAGDFFGREGLVAFCEMYTRNLKVLEFQPESFEVQHNKTVVRGMTKIRSRFDKSEFLELWKHEVYFGPGGDKITKVAISIDLDKLGDKYASMNCSSNPFTLKEDHPRAVRSRRILSLSMNDFTVHHVIGKGGFGTVVVAKKKSDGRVYAIKILDKFKMTKYDVESSFTEMRIGQTIHHPFIAGLQLAFQSRSKLFLGMKFYAGGDLFHHMSRGATCRIAPTRAKFYSAELILAIHHLHKHDILYRDLKPENVMIDADGHIGLVDFGLAKMHVSDYKGAKTLAGSPQYTAPELLAPKDKRVYGKMIDWWSLGVLMFEMSCGKSPFHDTNIDRMYKKIQTEEIKFPPNIPITDELKDFLSGLLRKDPKERLGNKFSDLSSHPFYRGWDWDKLLAREVTAPWKPNIKSDTCVDYVDQEFSVMDPEQELKSPAAQTRHNILESALEKFRAKAAKNKANKTTRKQQKPAANDEGVFRDFVYDCEDPNKLVQMDALLHEIHPTPHGGTPLAAFVVSGTLEYPSDDEDKAKPDSPFNFSDDEEEARSETSNSKTFSTTSLSNTDNSAYQADSTAQSELRGGSTMTLGAPREEVLQINDIETELVKSDMAIQKLGIHDDEDVVTLNSQTSPVKDAKAENTNGTQGGVKL